jgi:hypothetical protein
MELGHDRALGRHARPVHPMNGDEAMSTSDDRQDADPVVRRPVTVVDVRVMLELNGRRWVIESDCRPVHPMSTEQRKPYGEWYWTWVDAPLLRPVRAAWELISDCPLLVAYVYLVLALTIL